ncbi:MAG: glycosyltransferase [Verrucomicrobiota bacterium]
MADYAIIIPAYNEEALLEETILATRRAMAEVPLSGQLIVVDNNSSDRTAKVARKKGADLVIFESKNQIARARNTGARHADAPLLVFIDADTKAPPATLKKALDLLQSGEIVGGGARIVMDQDVSAIVASLTRNWNRVGTIFRYAAGSFFYCRADGFDEVGGFDESVYAGEEVWLAKRLKRWGRQRNLKFEVISDPPVVTSGRKSDWFSTWDFVKQLLVIFLLPGSTRSRKFCRVWYERPDTTPDGS